MNFDGNEGVPSAKVLWIDFSRNQFKVITTLMG